MSHTENIAHPTMHNPSTDRIKSIVLAGVTSAGAAAFMFWVAKKASLWSWIAAGVVLGIMIGLIWPIVRSFTVQLRVEDWRLEEVEIQGLKVTSAGAQRRVAWRLFVEMATRI